MDKLKDRLRKCIKNIEESRNFVPPAKREEIETDEFKASYDPGLAAAESSYKSIPRFYNKLPKVDDTLAKKLREEARALFLQTKSGELLSGSELKHLWTLLDKGDLSTNGDAKFLNYSEFKRVGEKAGPEYKSPGVNYTITSHYMWVVSDHFISQYLKGHGAFAAKLIQLGLRNDTLDLAFFTAVVFAKLQREHRGKVHINTWFNYAMRKVWLCETRIALSLHDPTGQGYLREHDLDNYIMELVPTLPALDGLDSSFSSFYVCTATRKFLFFLDPLRTGRVRIIDILSSNFLEDLLELREEDLLKETQEKNWFSAPSALRVYGQYLNLDKDHNGMLSLDELQDYGSGTLTQVFLNRVFQQCLTYDGEMDYKTYLDLVLALENRREPQSIHYLFRILDIHGQGYLDGFTLNYFFKAIQEQMLLNGANPVNFEDVKDEIFDMVRPADPTKITLKDLISSGYGGTAISILIEFQYFLAYEHREILAAVSPD